MSAASSSPAAPRSWRERVVGAAAFRFESLLVLAALDRHHGVPVAGVPLGLELPQHCAVDLGVRRAGDRHDLRHLLGRHRSLASARSSALSGVVGALATANLGLPWPACIVACLAAGAFAGWVNGFLITSGEIPPFIVTLGMLGVARGIGAGAEQRRVDLRPAARGRLSRPGPAVRRAGAGDRAAADRVVAHVLLDPHPLRRLRAGDRRQRGGGARDGRARRAPQDAALRALRRCSPASPACCSPRASIPASRRRGSTTSSPPSPRRSSAAPTCSAAAAASSARSSAR